MELIAPRERSIGKSTVRRVLPFATRRTVGPFIFLDLIGPETIPAGREMNVDAHPHIGLSTLTYLFDGRMVHRDSTGAVQSIEPGAVNWMTAGSGVTHTERSHPDDVPVDLFVRGAQIWIALPDGGEDVEPFFLHVPAREQPRFGIGPANIRVAAGTAWGQTSPVPVSSPLVLADLALDGSEPLRLDDTHPERGLLPIEGELVVDGMPVPTGHLAVVEPGPVELTGWGRALFIGGEPVGPRTIWWNFVHSDPARIEQAKADWAEQRFPLVPDDHDPWVPLPGAGG
jgi:redox-sensitive bicupin YhaK (pirin superfamily)